NFLDLQEDFFELLAVADVEGYLNFRVQIFADAFEVADVGVDGADSGGDFGEHARAILCEDAEANRESGGLGGSGPFGGDAALGLVEEILNVGTSGGMHGDAASARDVADDIVAGNRVAAFRAIDHQIVVSANLDGRVLHSQHALHGGNEFRGFLLGGFRERLTGRFRENLARRPFAVAQVGVKIFNPSAAVFGSYALPILIGDFLETQAAVAGFAFEEAAADGGSFFAFVEINPVAHFAAPTRRLHEFEPIAAGPVIFLRDDLDHVAIGEHMAQRNHLAVHLGSDALMADFGVDQVREIDRSGAARQDDDASLGRKRIDLFGVEIHFERGQEFAGLFHLLHPLDELAHPDDAMIVGIRGRTAVFVLPVRGDALLGDAVHFLGANLNFERLAGVNDGGVERLIEVGARHGDVVFEAARDRAPNLMHNAQSGVTVLDRIGDNADGHQVVDLIESALLALHFM